MLPRHDGADPLQRMARIHLAIRGGAATHFQVIHADGYALGSTLILGCELSPRAARVGDKTIPVEDDDVRRERTEHAMEKLVAFRDRRVSPLALGDVARDGQQPHDLSPRVGHRRDHRVPPLGLTLRRRPEPLERTDAAGLRLFERRACGQPAFARPEFDPRAVEVRVRVFDPQQLLPPLTDVEQPPFEVENLDAVAAALDDPAVELLALAERLLSPLARADVFDDNNQVRRLTVGVVPHERGRQVDPDRRAVLSEVPLLEGARLNFPRLKATRVLQVDFQGLRGG